MTPVGIVIQEENLAADLEVEIVGDDVEVVQGVEIGDEDVVEAEKEKRKKAADQVEVEGKHYGIFHQKVMKM